MESFFLTQAQIGIATMAFEFFYRSRIPPYIGRGRIAGATAIDAVPAAALVKVFLKSNNRVVGAARSASDGNYEVGMLNTNMVVYVIAFDPDEQFNAVIFDNVVPVT
mgnify:CR=1 FL=1